MSKVGSDFAGKIRPQRAEGIGQRVAVSLWYSGSGYYSGKAAERIA
jgi:hypothetical protein